MKETIVRVEGLVTKNLSNGLYQVTLSNGKNIIASVGGKMRKYSIRVLVNDKVDVEMSAYDLGKGRIVRRK